MPAAMRLLRYRCAWLGDTPARCATAESGTGPPQAASAARTWSPVSTDWMPRRCASERPLARAGALGDRGVWPGSSDRFDPVLDLFGMLMSSMSVATRLPPARNMILHYPIGCPLTNAWQHFIRANALH